MMFTKKWILAIELMMVSLMAVAAPAVPTYFCNFENAEESSEWISWKGSSLHSETWKTGSKAHCTGTHAIYTSNLQLDSVGNNTHSWAKNGGYTVSAYRKMTLTPGTYTISLDYMCPDEMITVALIQADTLTSTQIKTTSGSDYPSIIKTNIVTGLKDMKSISWTHATANVTISGLATNYILVVSYRSQGSSRAFGAAVDNVEVVKRQSDPTACDYAIQNFKVELLSGEILLTWRGNADQYEVMYYNSDSLLVDMGTIPATGAAYDSARIEMEYLPDGVYGFMVRAVGCTNDAKSGWAYVNNKLVYDPGAHCIDYLNFDAAGVSCEYGTLGTSTDDQQRQGTHAVDFGAASVQSRHTIHYKPGERDALTDNRLRTVPDGSFASVRLGNWNTGAEYESVTYTIHVDSTMGVLLLRYALVQENPGHDQGSQPRFDLRLLNSRGQLIGGECGVVDLRPPTSGAGDGQWRTASGGNVWRDWTTIGVNLWPYLGETVKVQITNSDCSQSGHYGYGYFVLDCSSGEVKGMTCGEKPRSLKVDDGFNYRWYKPYNPTEPFYAGQNPTSDSIYVSVSDTNTYYCDLIRKDNPNCSFTLHAYAIKRLPMAEVGFHHTPVNCINQVTLEPLSAVYGYYPKADGTGDSIVRRDEQLYREVHEWSTTSGMMGTLTGHTLEPIAVPEHGDTITVHVTAYMKEGCVADTTMTYIVPAIHPTYGDDTRFIADGDSTLFHDVWYKTEGDYVHGTVNYAGCDSTETLHLQVIYLTRHESADSICYGDSLEFQGKYYKATGIYSDTVRSLRLPTADSIIYTLDLKVFEPLNVMVSQQQFVVHSYDDVIMLPYRVLSGTTSKYSLTFGQDGTQAGLVNQENTSPLPQDQLSIAFPPLQDREAGIYEASFAFENATGCEGESFTITFDVRSVLVQLDTVEVCQTNPMEYPYTFRGRRLTVSGDYTDTLRSRVYSDVDSVVYMLHFSVYEALAVAIPGNEFPDQVCGDDAYIGFTIQSTHTDVDYRIYVEGLSPFEVLTGVMNEQQEYVEMPIPAHVIPGAYNMCLEVTSRCDQEVTKLPFTIHYPASVAPQKWNNVLVLLDPSQNGGYAFSHIQWYRNGSPIVGENDSYLYLGEGVTFEPFAIYTVGLIREGESLEVQSCPLGDLAAAPMPDVDMAPVRQLLPGHLPEQFVGLMEIYDIFGRLVMAGDYDYDYITRLTQSGIQPVYLVKVSSPDEQQVYKVH